MKLSATGLVLAALLATSACQMTATEATVVGATAGAAGGLVLADLFDADDDWRLISALAGAAAGTLIAHNERTKECAYADGRGGYVVRRCS